MKTLKLGIIGGGLMGREAATALGRWFALKDFPAKLELHAVCDLNPEILEWYKQVPTVAQLTTDHKELLANGEVDIVYVAVPHNLHKTLYTDVLMAGKDLFAEKPFGIDLTEAREIKALAEKEGCFVRCSSEFPYFPGVQRVKQEVESGRLGRVMEVRAGFLHASDLNPQKAINWKRQVKTCGEEGVMADLGLHVAHLPLRMGWKPKQVFAHLQNIIAERPDGKGGTAACDTFDNARLYTRADIAGEENVPMTWEMKRMAPSETNTWYIEVIGTEGCVAFSTKEPKTLWTCTVGKEQPWQKTDLGHAVPFPTITGGIFEVGFPDVFLQMFAAYVAEREGFLEGRFGCATMEEAVGAHEVFEAALRSHKEGSAVDLATDLV